MAILNFFRSGPDLNDPEVREKVARQWGGGRYERLQAMPAQIDQLKRKLKDVQHKIDELYGEAGKVSREQKRDIKGRNQLFFENKQSDLSREIRRLNERDMREADRELRAAQSTYYRELKEWNKLPRDVQDSAYRYFKNPGDLQSAQRAA